MEAEGSERFYVKILQAKVPYAYRDVQFSEWLKSCIPFYIDLEL